MFDSRGRDTSALVAVDTDTGDTRELAVDPRSDVAGTMVHPVTRRPQAVAFEYDRVTWKILDDSIAADIERITDDRKGQFALTSCSMDDLKWVVEYEKDDGPKTYYLYKREYRGDGVPVLQPPGIGERPILAPMHSAIVSSRDGLDIVVYYSSAGRLDKPRPLTARRNRSRRC